MKTPTDLFAYLATRDITYTLWQHEPLITVEEARKVLSDVSGAHCKNLFLKDDNGKFWLIVASIETAIALKKVAKKIGAPGLRFAKPELLLYYLGVLPGSVTPMALINTAANSVSVLIDSHIYSHATITMHPLVNTASITISLQDFDKFLMTCPNAIQKFDFTNM